MFETPSVWLAYFAYVACDIACWERIVTFEMMLAGSTSDMVSGLAMMPSHEEDSLATISDLEHGLSLPLDHSEDSDSNPDEHQIQVQIQETPTTNVLICFELTKPGHVQGVR